MIKEYGEVEPGGMAVRSTLSTSGRYRLTHSTAGFECAGSCARSTDEKWGVLSIGRLPAALDGCEQGRWFRTPTEAKTLFDKWATS